MVKNSLYHLKGEFRTTNTHWFSRGVAINVSSQIPTVLRAVTYIVCTIQTLNTLSGRLLHLFMWSAHNESEDIYVSLASPSQIYNFRLDLSSSL